MRPKSIFEIRSLNFGIVAIACCGARIVFGLFQVLLRYLTASYSETFLNLSLSLISFILINASIVFGIFAIVYNNKNRKMFGKMPGDNTGKTLGIISICISGGIIVSYILIILLSFIFLTGLFLGGNLYY